MAARADGPVWVNSQSLSHRSRTTAHGRTEALTRSVPRVYLASRLTELLETLIHLFLGVWRWRVRDRWQVKEVRDDQGTGGKHGIRERLSEASYLKWGLLGRVE